MAAANGRTFARSFQRITQHYNKISTNVTRKSRISTGNLTRTATCSATLRLLTGQDALMNKSFNRQVCKVEMRQMQRSAAVLSLSSKVSACLNLACSSDSDVTDASEDSDDVCSQPGHKLRKNRYKETYNSKTI